MTIAADTAPTDDALAIPFGLDMSEDDCWRIFDSMPNKKMLEDERFLFGQKWFDYRRMHAVTATFTYMHAYNAAYKEVYSREIDRSAGEHVQGISNHDLFTEIAAPKMEKAERKRVLNMTGCWKGRQYADLMGMPYPTFIRLAMKNAMRRSRKFLPRPNQLYGFDLLTAVSSDWREHCEARAVVAEDPIFKNENYRGAPVQDAHHDWLLELCATRANPGPLLSQLLYVDDVLLEQKVAARFGAEAVESARRYS